MAIVFDVETLAVDGIEIEPVSAPPNYKDPEKITAYILEAEKAQREKAGLYPWTNCIIALGWCEETDDVERVTIANGEAAEATMIREFLERVVDARTSAVTPLVGFNHLAFDLPTLMARARLLGVRCPEFSIDRYRSPHPDLMQILTFRGAIAARSLKWYAKRFGLNTDDAFSGKEIATLYEDQNWDAIKAHCASDVRLTRQLAERLGVMKPRPVAA
jgi:predicted PolB exonuclease-like 3'-5' exonuclease